MQSKGSRASSKPEISDRNIQKASEQQGKAKDADASIELNDMKLQRDIALCSSAWLSKAPTPSVQ